MLCQLYIRKKKAIQLVYFKTKKSQDSANYICVKKLCLSHEKLCKKSNRDGPWVEGLW